MDKETHGEGGGPPDGEDESITASGDAIIISAGLHDLADSFREVAKAIRLMIPDDSELEDDRPHDRYLDGTPRPK